MIGHEFLVTISKFYGQLLFSMMTTLLSNLRSVSFIAQYGFMIDNEIARRGLRKARRGCCIRRKYYKRRFYVNIFTMYS